jgi:hypothetical protein
MMILPRDIQKGIILTLHLARDERQLSGVSRGPKPGESIR